MSLDIRNLSIILGMTMKPQLQIDPNMQNEYECRFSLTTKSTTIWRRKVEDGNHLGFYRSNIASSKEALGVKADLNKAC